MTLEEMWAEFYAYKFHENPDGFEEIEDTEFDLDAVMQQLEDDPDNWETVFTT